MTKERIINTRFWDDSYIGNLDPIEKLIFIYLLTNPNTNIAGIYEIQVRKIEFDTGVNKDMVIKIFERFEKDEKIYYKNNFVIIKNFIKFQHDTPKIRRGIEIIFNALPDEIKAFYDTLSIPYRYDIDRMPAKGKGKGKDKDKDKVKDKGKENTETESLHLTFLPFTFFNFSFFTLEDLQKTITEAVEYYCNINLTASELTRLINIVTKTKQVKKETAWNYVVTELQNFRQYPEDKKNMKYLCAKIEGKINDQLTKLREIKTKQEKQERITENSEIAEKIDFSEIVKSLSV